MALVLTDERNYEDIADALRELHGDGETYLPSEMADAIRSSACVASPRMALVTLSPVNRYSIYVTTDTASQAFAETVLTMGGSMFNATATGE